MASLSLFYSKNVYFAILTFHICHVIAYFVTLPPVSNVKVYDSDNLPKPISVDKVIFHQMCSNKRGRLIFTSFLMISSPLTQNSLNLPNYYLQEVFQNGRQNWVSFFMDHPVYHVIYLFRTLVFFGYLGTPFWALQSKGALYMLYARWNNIFLTTFVFISKMHERIFKVQAPGGFRHQFLAEVRLSTHTDVNSKKNEIVTNP